MRSKWILVAPTLRDLMILCHDMAPDERAQWRALVDPAPYDFEQAAAKLYTLPGVKFALLGPRGQLIGAGGYVDQGHGVLRDWLVAPPESWSTHWRSITEACKFAMDCLLDDGYRRLETCALASRTRAHRWYEKGLGMTHEGTLRAYGIGGEDVVIYSRVANVGERGDNVAEQRHTLPLCIADSRSADSLEEA